MKFRTAVTILFLWTVVVIIGNLKAQTSTNDDLSAMIQAVESTTPSPASSVTSGSTLGYYSAQQLSWPPVPSNFNQVDVWDLGSGMYLLDDTNVDYTATSAQASPSASQSGSRMAMAESSPPVPGGGSGGTNFTSNGLGAPPVNTNLLWLQITNISGESPM